MAKVEQKYKEILLLPSQWVNGKEYNKGATIRTVMLTPQVAKFNNEHPNLTGCKYVPFDEKPKVSKKPEDIKKAKRNKLFAEAKKLGIKVPINIPNDKLVAKIQEVKEQVKIAKEALDPIKEAKHKEGDIE